MGELSMARRLAALLAAGAFAAAVAGASALQPADFAYAQGSLATAQVGTQATAAGVSYLAVGNEELVFDGEVEPSGDSRIAYNASTNTLTLKGLALDEDSGAENGISYTGDKAFTVVLEGSNTIDCGADGGTWAINMQGKGSLTVKGSGSLTAKNCLGIIGQDTDWETRKDGDIIIDGATLVGDGYGIWSHFSNITIKNSATVRVNNTTLDITGDYNEYLGITTGRAYGGECYAGKLTVQNSTVELKQSKEGPVENSTLLAWNSLSTSGVNVYVGASSAQYATTLPKVAEDFLGRKFYQGTYLLITPTKRSLPELVVGTTKVTFSKSAFTYTGKVQKPAVTVKVNGKKVAASNYTVAWPKGCKAIGSYEVGVTLKNGYAGKASASYKINPKPTAIKKLTPKKKSFAAKWKKVAGVDGYEVQYSLKKNFKSAKTVKVAKAKTVSKVVKKLKAKKKYYVRVRTYKGVEQVSGGYGGMVHSYDVYYSTWSKAKAVKVK